MRKINAILASILLVLIIYFVVLSPDKLDFVKKYNIDITNIPNVCGDVKLGGFSDLFYKDGYLYAITDRGPNSDDFEKDGQLYRTFLCKDYTTNLIKFKIENDKVNIVDIKKIKGLSGMPISAERDSIPVDKNGKQLPFDINGADVESFVIDKDGNYWLGEEYYPSIIKLDKNLNVVKRFAPVNSKVKNPKITYNLPEQFNNIQKNLGFESMVYDGEDHIYVFTQAGLNGEKNISVIKFNIKTEQAEDVFKYRFFKSSILSGAVYLKDKNKLLTGERLYESHFINGFDFGNNKITRKSILRPLTESDKITKNIKIEGITADEDGNVYIINDNDFGIDSENIKNSFIMQFKLKKGELLQKK